MGVADSGYSLGLFWRGGARSRPAAALDTRCHFVLDRPERNSQTATGSRFAPALPSLSKDPEAAGFVLPGGALGWRGISVLTIR
jgi:hypothetical protein